MATDIPGSKQISREQLQILTTLKVY